jgi:putative PEP-CTERM system histidine kinase
LFRFAARYSVEQDLQDLSNDDSVVEFVRERHWLIDLAEYRREPDLYQDLELPDWVSQVNLPWLFVPLNFARQTLGIVLLNAAPGVPRLNYEDRDLLKTAGNHIAVHLAQQNVDSQLAESRQFEAYNRLTAFLMHDLNNLIAQQSLIVKNAEKHKRNPEFVDDAIATIASSVDRMRKVMEQLKRGHTVKGARPSVIGEIVSAAVDRCVGRGPEPTLDLLDGSAELVANRDQFTMVLTHLIRNAQDATPETGQVTVQVDRSEGYAIVRVIDNGHGMSAEFIRDRLFRPFDSTKGAGGMGIGAYQAREFVRRLGGEMRVASAPQEGTTVTISVPVHGAR